MTRSAVRGGVPVAGADPAATLQLPVATALVTHELIDDPRRNAFVLKPGRKAVAKLTHGKLPSSYVN
jgi:hypothetical protein